VPADQPPWILDARLRAGQRIHARRMHQNVTQEKLRELTGISVDTIQRIEGGHSDAKLSQLLLIAAALDVHPTELLAD